MEVVAITLPPPETYLTDGTALVYVTGYTDTGDVLVEDCLTEKLDRIVRESIDRWKSPAAWRASLPESWQK